MTTGTTSRKWPPEILCHNSKELIESVICTFLAVCFWKITVSIDMDSEYMGEIVIVIANGRFRSLW